MHSAAPTEAHSKLRSAMAREVQTIERVSAPRAAPVHAGMHSVVSLDEGLLLRGRLASCALAIRGTMAKWLIFFTIAHRVVALGLVASIIKTRSPRALLLPATRPQ